jgi:hypothetical protein
MSDSWDYDDEAREEPRPPLLLPLIATGVAAALLLLLAFAMPRSLDIAHNDSSVIGAVVAGLIIGIILWGIAFAITIRRAGGGWQVGTLLFVIAVGVGSQVAAITLAASRISGDMATVAQQYRALSAGGQLPERVPEGTGPVSRMSAVFLNGTLQDRRAFDHDAEALGVLQILSHEGLTRTSPVLHHCGDFDALAARARRLGSSGWEGHFAEARRLGDEAVRNREMTAGDADAFFASAQENRYSYQRQWLLDAELIEDAQELCELLARRPWVVRGTDLLFSSPADLEEARFHLERIRIHAAEQRIAADAVRQQMNQDAGRLQN